MDDEIQLISDGAGLAVIGDPAAVERFLVSEGLPSKDLGLQRLSTTVGKAAAAFQAGSDIAANSGRWVQLTQASADAAKKYGLMTNSTSGLSMGVVQAKGAGGGIKHIVQFTKGPGSVLTNPAILAGAAGIMSQYAMQQTMDEILDYLAKIDEKVEDILRSQKDAIFADMLGVGLAIDEAMSIRDEVGRVSEITWSKVQATSVTIGRTQMYALRQLDALAEKLEKKSAVGDVAKASKDAERTVREWLAVLARCVQLSDAIAILELDRVLDAAPDEVDQHRLGIRMARARRLDLIDRSTGTLIARMNAAANGANSKVLLHPNAARSVVVSSNSVSASLLETRQLLGIESGRESVEARRWRDAATDARDRIVVGAVDAKDKVVEVGSGGMGLARRAGNDSVDKAKSIAGRLTDGVAVKIRRHNEDRPE